MIIMNDKIIEIIINYKQTSIDNLETITNHLHLLLVNNFIRGSIHIRSHIYIHKLRTIIV